MLELVEGPTLADRIAQGRVPIGEALSIAKQIAEALEAAHERGIIHRDLKPANVKVREDGFVKVLDFGLAKAAESPSPGGSVTASPTITSPATRVGTLLGTAAYMSPEQARGRPVDKRSDIWAFGCVLFELLTGSRTFGGDDITDTLAFVITKEPDWNALPASTPEAIRKLLRRCLEKDRMRRLADIADARLEIEEAMTTSAAQTAPSASTAVDRKPATLSSHARYAWAASALFLVTTLVLAGVLYFGRSNDPAPVARFTVAPPDKTVFHLPGTGPAASIGFNGGSISPDGRALVLSLVDSTGKLLLWLRSIDSLVARPLQGTDGGLLPFWSPDSRVLGFFADGKLKTIDIAGGPPRTLCNIGPSNPRGGTWNRDGTILFAAPDGPIARVPATGGEPVPVTRLQKDHTAHRRPFFLPDGRHFLYRVIFGAPNTSPEIVVGSLDSDETKPLLRADTQAIYTPPGYLLFIRQGSLLAQRFDTEGTELTGEPFPLAERVATDELNGLSAFSASNTGVLAYRTGLTVGGDADSSVQLSWVDRQGKEVEQVGAPAPYRGTVVSPDGTRIAAHRHEGGGGDIWLLERTRGTTQRLTFDASQDNNSPVWSPDGDRIAFASRRDNSWGIFVRRSDGTGSDERILQSTTPALPVSWSPNGQFLVYMVNDPKTLGDIWVLPLTGGKKPFPVVQGPFNEAFGQISPDGRWLAYQSTETGRVEVYVRPFPSGPGKWSISTAGGVQPRWRPDGSEVFYAIASGNGQLVSVGVKTAGTAFQATGVPKVLFESGGRPPTGNANLPFLTYAVAPDGQRFLLPRTADSGESPPATITVVLNWQEELNRR